MQNGTQERSGFALLELIIMLIALAVFWFLVVKPIGKLAKDNHEYLGTNRGPESQWKGLVGNIEENNQFHRGKYDAIDCRLWKLEQPAAARAQRAGDQCPPPSQGPPTSRPTSPPPKP
jgi:hypothetical protein